MTPCYLLVSLFLVCVFSIHWWFWFYFGKSFVTSDFPKLKVQMSLGIAVSLLVNLNAFPCFFGIGPVDYGSSSNNFRWDEDIIWTVKVSFTLISISWTQRMACQCSPLTYPLRRRCFPWFLTIRLSRVSGKCKYEIYIFPISNNIELKQFILFRIEKA